MELAWVALLFVALARQETRFMALLLAVKWALNYTTFLYVAQAAPAIVDVVFGAAGVMLAARLRRTWSDVALFGFIFTPVVHLWFWGGGAYITGVEYYWLVVSLFSVQVIGVASPSLIDGAHRFVAFLRSSLRPPGGHTRTVC